MKTCNGFDSFCCYCCERFNKDATGTIVKKLAVDPDTGKETCNYWIRMNLTPSTGNKTE